MYETNLKEFSAFSVNITKCKQLRVRPLLEYRFLFVRESTSSFADQEGMMMLHIPKRQPRLPAKLLKDDLANMSKRDSNLLRVSLLLGTKNVMPQVRKKKFKACSDNALSFLAAWRS